MTEDELREAKLLADILADTLDYEADGVVSHRDAAYLHAARRLFPALLAEVERLRKFEADAKRAYAKVERLQREARER